MDHYSGHQCRYRHMQNGRWTYGHLAARHWRLPPEFFLAVFQRMSLSCLPLLGGLVGCRCKSQPRRLGLKGIEMHTVGIHKWIRICSSKLALCECWQGLRSNVIFSVKIVRLQVSEETAPSFEGKPWTMLLGFGWQACAKALVLSGALTVAPNNCAYFCGMLDT